MNARTPTIITVLVALIGCAGIVTAALFTGMGVQVYNDWKNSPPSSQTPAQPRQSGSSQPGQPTLLASPRLMGRSSGLAKGETRVMQPGMYVVGDITVDGVPQYDNGDKEGTVVYFERQASVFAQWGAACYTGDARLLREVIQSEFNHGCIQGCARVRAVIVRANGRQEATCYQPDGTTRPIRSDGQASWCD